MHSSDPVEFTADLLPHASGINTIAVIPIYDNYPRWEDAEKVVRFPAKETSVKRERIENFHIEEHGRHRKSSEAHARQRLLCVAVVQRAVIDRQQVATALFRECEHYLLLHSTIHSSRS